MISNKISLKILTKGGFQREKENTNRFLMNFLSWDQYL